MAWTEQGHTSPVFLMSTPMTNLREKIDKLIEVILELQGTPEMVRAIDDIESLLRTEIIKELEGVRLSENGLAGKNNPTARLINTKIDSRIEQLTHDSNEK